MLPSYHTHQFLSFSLYLLITFQKYIVDWVLQKCNKNKYLFSEVQKLAEWSLFIKERKADHLLMTEQNLKAGAAAHSLEGDALKLWQNINIQPVFIGNKKILSFLC